MGTLEDASLYERIYAVTRQVPEGSVSTYGQIAAIVGRGCTARQVGYAMAALRADDNGPCKPTGPDQSRKIGFKLRRPISLRESSSLRKQGGAG